MCRVQSSLLLLYYVAFSVMSVQYCLCVSRIQCTQCLQRQLSLSAYYYSVLVVFSCQWRSVSVQCLQRSGCVLISGSCSVCTLQCLQCSRALAVHQECVMSTLGLSSAPAQFLNFNIPSTTEGHLRTKYNLKIIIFKSTYLSLHNDTFWYGFIFGRYSPGERTRQLQVLNRGS